MRYQAFYNRISKLEADRQISGQDRYYKIGCGIINLSQDYEGHSLRMKIIDWTNTVRTESMGVVLGGIYNILSKYPNYLETTLLEDIPTTIDSESRKILYERYQITIPSSDFSVI